MDDLEVLEHNTNEDSTNEININSEEESNIDITSINDAEISEDIEIETISETDISTVQEDVINADEKGSTPTEENTEITALVEVKPHGLLVAQTMFKKSIKISIKSFLISLSLGFLNLFF